MDGNSIGIKFLVIGTGFPQSVSFPNHASNLKRLVTKPWLPRTPQFLRLLHGLCFTLGQYRNWSCQDVDYMAGKIFEWSAFPKAYYGSVHNTDPSERMVSIRGLSSSPLAIRSLREA